MVRRFNRTGKGGVHSQQEQDLRSRYPNLSFKPDPLKYYSVNKYYPDFYLGVDKGGKACYLEAKEYIAYSDVAKYENVVRSNPNMRLYFLVFRAEVRTIKRIEKFAVVAQHWAYLPQEWRNELT